MDPKEIKMKDGPLMSTTHDLKMYTVTRGIDGYVRCDVTDDMGFRYNLQAPGGINFEVGYGGTGPRLLARAILYDYFGLQSKSEDDRVSRLVGHFKLDFIQCLGFLEPGEVAQYSSFELADWIAAHGNEGDDHE
jgi:hypothetical protein